ncbi:MAG: DUF952 domain-containing protein [Rhizobiaceae bacterium]
MDHPDIIFKIADRQAWAGAREKGEFGGAPVDITDGFIHFSTAEQVRETATKHFAGADNLVLIAVDAAKLLGKIVWEPSRGGALFPHLYEPLNVDAVLWEKPIPLQDDGNHEFPDGIA